MKSAQELKNNKQIKLQQRLKENTERINMELVEIEKAQNKWESDLDNKNPYFEIPIIIKTQEVKTLLAEQGYIIDKISNNIKVNTSRLWLDKEDYNNAIGTKYSIKNNYNIEDFDITKADLDKVKAYYDTLPRVKKVNSNQGQKFEREIDDLEDKQQNKNNSNDRFNKRLGNNPLEINMEQENKGLEEILAKLYNFDRILNIQ